MSLETLRSVGERGKWVAVHGVSVEKWMKRFGVEPFSAPCEKCGRERTASIPIAYAEFRGLLAPPCECGNDGNMHCVVVDPRKGDLLEGLW